MLKDARVREEDRRLVRDAVGVAVPVTMLSGCHEKVMWMASSYMFGVSIRTMASNLVAMAYSGYSMASNLMGGGSNVEHF